MKKRTKKEEIVPITEKKLTAEEATKWVGVASAVVGIIGSLIQMIKQTKE